MVVSTEQVLSSMWRQLEFNYWLMKSIFPNYDDDKLDLFQVVGTRSGHDPARILREINAARERMIEFILASPTYSCCR